MVKSTVINFLKHGTICDVQWIKIYEMLIFTIQMMKISRETIRIPSIHWKSEVTKNKSHRLSVIMMHHLLAEAVFIVYPSLHF
ncbi:hypothetical protein CD134_07400 [Staphylococcus lutrae]|uniref:Uncharacterized protein n=1 Tax=Staphylococcus lutrae TaxID=155085 RepID=A0AAC9RVY1_9STAP|nr:hypothetical protein B5P37_05580 [Staphylococcus lutrae]PNZ36817.1 hypothetical protein CD134_07400 [Staphylococcus lutrae]